MKNPILDLLINKIFIMKKLERKVEKLVGNGFDDACQDHLVPPSELPEPGGFIIAHVNMKSFAEIWQPALMP